MAQTQRENVFPAATKGFISVPNVDVLRAKWNETQLGQMTKDPAMEPFIEDLKKQLRDKLSQTGVKLGLTWADLEGVYSGEVAVGAIQPNNDAKAHALALLVDISGNHDAAKQLIEKVAANVKEKGGTKAVKQVGNHDVIHFTVPDEEVEGGKRNSFYVIHKDDLLATDHQGVLIDMLSRLDGTEGPVLSDVKAFSVAMESSAVDGVTPEIRWFIEPFGYAEVMRAASPSFQPNKIDLVKVLANQGFREAIQGLGGHVMFATESHELQHRTKVYAPAVQRSPEDKETHKYNKAARMLEFPNRKGLSPQKFIPHTPATYLSFHWNMIDAFEHSKTLVNELIGSEPGQDLFEEIIGSLATDPDGPRVDIRKDLIHHFSDRATLISESKQPITPKSERILIAIALNNVEAVRETINRAMEADPDAQLKKHKGHMIWEIVPQDAPVVTPDLEVFDPFGEDQGAKAKKQEEKKRPVPKNSAITVLFGHLVAANNIDYIRDLIDKNDKEEGKVQRLSEASDYRAVDKALQELGADADAFRVFTRTDDAYRATYELLRQGDMPKAETMLGKLLNRMLTTDDDDLPREQQIDGSKLPPFAQVQKYLGPAGTFVTTTDDGWFAAGCLLKKTPVVSQADAKTDEEATRR